MRGIFVQIFSIDQDSAGAHIVKAQKKPEQGGFPAAGGAGQKQGFVSPDFQVKMFQNVFLPGLSAGFLFRPGIGEGNILKDEEGGGVSAGFGGGGDADLFLRLLQKTVDPLHAGDAFKQLRKPPAGLQSGPDQAGLKTHQSDEGSVGGLSGAYHQRARGKKDDAAENVEALVHGFQESRDPLPFQGFFRKIRIGQAVARGQGIRKLVLPDGQKAGEDICGLFCQDIIGACGKKPGPADPAGKGGIDEQAEQGQK